MPKKSIKNTFIEWIIAFSLSFFLFQILEDYISNQPDFVFKNLILLVIPAPQDSIIEFIQFLVYWITIVMIKFVKK